MARVSQGLQFLVQFKWYEPSTLCDLLARYAEVRLAGSQVTGLVRGGRRRARRLSGALGPR